MDPACFYFYLFFFFFPAIISSLKVQARYVFKHTLEQHQSLSILFLRLILCCCVFAARTLTSQVHAWWRWSCSLDERHIGGGGAEKKSSEQTNGRVRGFKGIEAKLKAGKHDEGTGDEWLVITWLGAGNCVLEVEGWGAGGGGPQGSGALGMVSSQLWLMLPWRLSRTELLGVESVSWLERNSNHFVWGQIEARSFSKTVFF